MTELAGAVTAAIGSGSNLPSTDVHTVHIWNSGIVVNEPTTTSAGIREYCCTVCGATKTEAIPQLPVPVKPAEKKANTLYAKGKTVKIKRAAVKKKNVVIKRLKAVTVKNTKGTVNYKIAKKNKKFTVAKNGKITVKKGLKKGTYKIKIRVTAAGNAEYKAAVKTVTVKIVIK